MSDANRKAGIYIHIPFCMVKCIYCDFYSVTKRDDSISQFIDCLIKEIELNKNIRCGGRQTIRVVISETDWNELTPKINPKDDVRPEAIYENLKLLEVDPREDFKVNCDTQLVTVVDGVNIPVIIAFRLLSARLQTERHI